MSAHVNEWSKMMGALVSMEVNNFSPQLFIKRLYKDRTVRKPYASSVLFTARDRYFVITAGHNYPDNENPENIGVLIDSEFVSFGSKGFKIEPNNEQEYNPSFYDLAIFELDLKKVETISRKYQFLDGSYLGLSHENDSALYLMFRFPQRKKTTALPYGAIEADGKFYLKPVIDKEKTLILNLRQKRSIHAASTQIQRLPKLHGISGAGVWGITYTSELNIYFQLVSIVTGQNPDGTALYSTKLTHLDGFMSHFFL